MSGHFGDLMAPTSSTGLQTTTTTRISDLLSFSPLERILLTANGNLQRIVSSYHAKPVQVKVTYNKETSTIGIFHRQVTLHLNQSEIPFCCATSKVTVKNEEMLRAIASNEIGIGQLFRRFDTLPIFTLLAVRRGECTNPKELVSQETELMWRMYIQYPNAASNGPFWRLYRLEAAAGIECVIHEQFQGNVLDL